MPVCAEVGFADCRTALTYFSTTWPCDMAVRQSCAATSAHGVFEGVPSPLDSMRVPPLNPYRSSLLCAGMRTLLSGTSASCRLIERLGKETHDLSHTMTSRMPC